MNPVQSHFMTMKKVIMSPKTFFDGISDRESYGKVFIFAFVNIVLASLVSLLFSLLGVSMGSYGGNGAFTTALGTGMVVTGILFMIPVMLVSLFIAAAVFHVIAWILGGKGAFQGSFSVVGYTTTLMPFTTIPYIGPIIGIYGIYLNIVGFRRIHKYSTARAVATILIPAVILGIFVIGAVVLGVLAALSLIKSGNMTPPNYQDTQQYQQMVPQNVQEQMQQIQDATSTYTYPTGYDDYINQ